MGDCGQRGRAWTGVGGRESEGMRRIFAGTARIGIAWICLGLTAGAQTEQKPARPQPELIHTCLITSDVRQLAAFYEPVLQMKAEWSGPDYAEFRTGAGVLAIFSAQAQERYIPGAAVAGQNHSVVLEFQVGDVDAEYRRLQSLVKVWVKPPTTQPWGTRSIYFRDPDGNLVDFYAPAKSS
jgi:catechol 2,3-dioxygenase-like lactoylglutathione lyase family enzyme